MKKILILGANNSQVQLIRAAKEEGYYVVVCDYADENPGIPLVDKHYQVSYLDQESVQIIGTIWLSSTILPAPRATPRV